LHDVSFEAAGSAQAGHSFHGLRPGALVWPPRPGRGKGALRRVEVIPLQLRVETVADQADLQDAYETERHLLYVACTRARNYLMVTSGDVPSEFLDDLPGDPGFRRQFCSDAPPSGPGSVEPARRKSQTAPNANRVYAAWGVHLSSGEYQTEAALVVDLVVCLAKGDGPLPLTGLISEFSYQRGRTDIVGLIEGGDVVAFEAKLTRWRDALHQAYRNLCFAHFSYVVLPRETALRAAQYEAEFSRRAVGICYVDNGALTHVWEPRRTEPLQPWLTEVAAARVEQLSTADATAS
jgi:hypothetical protein